MKKRLALISEHASPVAAVGGVDAGGQNIAVVELACGLVPRKGIATVIQALALLHQKHTIPAQLLIVGGNSSKLLTYWFLSWQIRLKSIAATQLPHH